MIVERMYFLDALKKALPGVEMIHASLIEGADTFIFSDGFIHSYNDNISVSVPFEMKDKKGNDMMGAIKAKDLYELINKLESKNLKIIPHEKTWELKSGNAIVELILLENDMVEKIKGIHLGKIKWKRLPKTFMRGLDICRFTNSKSTLSGVYVNGDKMMSTDEIRMNWLKLDEDLGEIFWISDVSCAELLKLKSPDKFAVDMAWVHFSTHDGTIFSCKKLVHDNYPAAEIEKLILMHMKTKSDVVSELPTKLIDAVNRASALSTNIESFDTIRLTFSNECIEVYSKRPSGKFLERVPWEKGMKRISEPISIFMDYSMVESGIKYSKSFYLKKVEMKTKTNTQIITRMVFVNPDGMQIVSSFKGDD